MKKHNAKSSFDQLTPAQKQAIYEECERVRPEDGKPLNARDRRLHRQAGLRVGRPRVGQGAKRINISMEKGLLKTADAVARQRGMTRAGLIAESVKAYLAGAA
jgi:hypothetical protein